jgi:hypothetical protein
MKPKEKNNQDLNTQHMKYPILFCYFIITFYKAPFHFIILHRTKIIIFFGYVVFKKTLQNLQIFGYVFFPFPQTPFASFVCFSINKSVEKRKVERKNRMHRKASSRRPDLPKGPSKPSSDLLP